MGYHNLYIIDLENQSIDFQKEQFKDINQGITIAKHDILNDNFLNIKFDVIIDKSFMDVFLRQTKAKLAFANTIKNLKCNALYIVISMFHRKWRSYCNNKTFSEVKYSTLQVQTFSRTRPTIATFSQQACILACVMHSKTKDKPKPTFAKSFTTPSNITFKDFHSVSSYEFPNDSSIV